MRDVKGQARQEHTYRLEAAKPMKAAPNVLFLLTDMDIFAGETLTFWGRLGRTKGRRGVRQEVQSVRLGRGGGGII